LFFATISVSRFCSRSNLKQHWHFLLNKKEQLQRMRLDWLPFFQNRNRCQMPFQKSSQLGLNLHRDLSASTTRLSFVNQLSTLLRHCTLTLLSAAYIAHFE
jgi:hypothetical protein